VTPGPGAAEAAALARAALATPGLPAALEALAAERGGAIVQRKDGRAVARIPAAGGAVWVKWFGRRRLAEGRAEARAYRTLHACGVPAAPLLAVEEAADGLALALGDAGPGLDAVLLLEGHLAGKLRERLRRAARTVRALHAAGLRLPDLLARHLRVGADGEARIIDPARLAGPGVAGAKGRARDLGALLATLPRPAVPERARLRLFREGASDLPRAERRRLAAAVAREAARDRALRRRRRGRVEWDPAHLPALRALVGDPASFDAWFEGEIGVRLRRLPDRENRRAEAGGRAFFLKRHFDGSRAGPAELEAALRFRRAGVPAALPAAWGEDHGRGSFWLAASAPGEPLDDLLRRGAVPAAARRDLARLLGTYAGRLRRAGLRHRDLYCNHWIGRWSAAGGWELSLIDLQRAGPVGLLRERRLVKDAAALWASAPRPPVTRTDAVRFLRAYAGRPGRLDAAMRRFAGRVARRAASDAARAPRTPVSGAPR
jgi:hypothetical protein